MPPNEVYGFILYANEVINLAMVNLNLFPLDFLFVYFSGWRIVWIPPSAWQCFLFDDDLMAFSAVRSFCVSLRSLSLFLFLSLFRPLRDKLHLRHLLQISIQDYSISLVAFAEMTKSHWHWQNPKYIIANRSVHHEYFGWRALCLRPPSPTTT